MDKVSVNQMQMPLRAQYKASPSAALVTDHARSKGADPRDPFHSTVEPMTGCGMTVLGGVHRAVGGPHDAPYCLRAVEEAAPPTKGPRTTKRAKRKVQPRREPRP